MRESTTWQPKVIAAAILSVAALAAAPSAASASWSSALYVNAKATSGHADSSCSTAGYATIDAAVSAAGAGTSIVVCPGTYNEGVLLQKRISLIGWGAVINAASSPFGNGVQIEGPGGSGSTVEGFKIENARFEGILVGTAPVAPETEGGTPVTSGQPVSGVRIANNTVVGNDTGAGSPFGQCYSTPEAPGDCGEAVHLVSVTNSVVQRNYVAKNAGGILLTDEFGPTSGNIIGGNQSIHNEADCGITLAGHNKLAVNPGTGQPTGMAGVFGNTISGNVSIGNGTKGQGAGILLGGGEAFAGVYDNVIRANVVRGNGLAGITIHQHLVGDLNGNVIEGNSLSENNLDGDYDFAAAQATETTDILVASGAPPHATLPPFLLPGPITGTVIRWNMIYGVKTGIWTLGVEPAGIHVSGNWFGPEVSTHLSAH